MENVTLEPSPCNIQLRCRHDMVDQLIDKFGYGIAIGNVTDETFDTIVEISASSTFYGWLFQYAGKIRIIAPGNVRQEYREMLRNELEDEELF